MTRDEDNGRQIQDQYSTGQLVKGDLSDIALLPGGSANADNIIRELTTYSVDTFRCRVMKIAQQTQPMQQIMPLLLLPSQASFKDIHPTTQPTGLISAGKFSYLDEDEKTYGLA
jgi:hypothetical protein